MVRGLPTDRALTEEDLSLLIPSQTHSGYQPLNLRSEVRCTPAGDPI